MSEDIEKYWETFWNNRATHGSQNDLFFQEISSDAIQSVLNPCKKLLVVGCGDGAGIEKYRSRAEKVVGVDYSKTAITKAQETYPGIEFIVGNILEYPFVNNEYDSIISERCICNLKSNEDQQKSLAVFYNCLKPDGELILCEPWLQGYNRIDEIRGMNDLPPLKRHWHNTLLDQRTVEGSQFNITYKTTFGMYTLISRVFHPKYIYPKEPKFGDKINEIAKDLNFFTMFMEGFQDVPSQHILYVLRKGE